MGAGAAKAKSYVRIDSGSPVHVDDSFPSTHPFSVCPNLIPNFAKFFTYSDPVMGDLENDPRCSTDNTLMRRLNLVSTYIVIAALLASLAWSAVLSVTPQDGDVWSWLEFLALLLFVLVTALNLFCVVILTQQLYLVSRLAAAGSMGFELGVILFLNPNYTLARHFAISSFEAGLPIFVVAMSLMVYQFINPFGDKRPVAILAVILLWALSAVMFFVRFIQKRRFNALRQSMKDNVSPLLDAVRSVNERNVDM
uniref:Uncharacterized protein n=1 Tax=Noctiluca scintillans TaxID=2966 RepID=A0A7S1AST3_NOCSC|mmetsp:Transcript_58577/g.155973  ORF Transcript_58577/g.155973 Transcript_58577/m.155973 type:complete len:253 (+) Transcript_58577:39-797(+)